MQLMLMSFWGQCLLVMRLRERGANVIILGGV